jgi:hypothetical protein
MSRLSRLPCLVKNNESSTNLKREKKIERKERRSVVRSLLKVLPTPALLKVKDVYLRVCVCVCVWVYVCVCEKEREKERKKKRRINREVKYSIYVSERERECVCVSVCLKEPI